MDILDDILDTLSLKGALYFRTDLSDHWAVEVPPLEQAARFHLVVQGICFVRVADHDPVRMGPGDMILIPRGSSHILSDCPVEKAPVLEDVLQRTGYDGSGVLSVGDGDPRASTQMICGHFTFRKGAEHPILDALPQFIVTSAADRAKHPNFDEILRLLTQRVFTKTAGSGATIIRLSEIVFIELLRVAVSNNAELNTIIKAFSDTQIGKALTLIHANPDRPWTVEALASEVGMSRSRFADRFGSLMGCGPMSYLSDWRLQKALALLDEGVGSIQEVARKTGYQSAAAFTRAFGGKFGISPKKYRKLA